MISTDSSNSGPGEYVITRPSDGQRHARDVPLTTARTIGRVVLAGLIGLMLLGGCNRRHPDAKECCPCSSGAQAPVVDVSLMAYLSMVRAAHHQADLCEQKRDSGCAIKALTHVVSSPLPGRKNATPIEAREVLADTLARLADLNSQQGKYKTAKQQTQRGLRIAPQGSYFEGRLLVVRGINGQRWAKAVKAAGDEQEAKTLRQQASKDLAKAVRIQDQVIRRNLHTDTQREP